MYKARSAAADKLGYNAGCARVMVSVSNSVRTWVSFNKFEPNRGILLTMPRSVEII